MNQLIPFKIENRGVRGFVVRIDEGIPELLGWREYSPDVFRLLGHALAAAPLLAADIGEGARFNLQFQGEGKKPLKMLVVQINHALQLRGMAKCEGAPSGDFRGLMAGGTLAAMLEPRSGGADRYQALVEIAGENLAEALQIYFAQSEQLPDPAPEYCPGGQARQEVPTPRENVPLGHMTQAEVAVSHTVPAAQATVRVAGRT